MTPVKRLLQLLMLMLASLKAVCQVGVKAMPVGDLSAQVIMDVFNGYELHLPMDWDAQVPDPILETALFKKSGLGLCAFQSQKDRSFTVVDLHAVLN